METDGTEPGMVGTTTDGLLRPSSNPPTGGMTPGEHGTPNGTAGTPLGDGIPHGDQDPLLGPMETGILDGTDPLSLQLEEELFILKHHK